MSEPKSLQILTDSSVAAFLAESGPLLYQTEPTNSLMLGLLEGIKDQTPKTAPLLIRIVENGRTVSTAVSFRVQPMNIILTYAKTAHLHRLAEFLKSSKEVFTGVVGPRAEAEAFAEIWKDHSGRDYELAMGQKIYKLEKVNFPKSMNGALKAATNAEVDFVFSWVKAFTAESLPGDRRSDEQWRDFTDRVIKRQGAHLWILDGKPVSMAMASRPTQNGVSINGVYTPPTHRKRGYASAIVASLSQKMLDQGKKFCVLYTDLSNPTSNKIYQEVGYREVCDSMHFNFVNKS